MSSSSSSEESSYDEEGEELEEEQQEEEEASSASEETAAEAEAEAEAEEEEDGSSYCSEEEEPAAGARGQQRQKKQQKKPRLLSDGELSKQIERLLQKVDLEKTLLRQFVKMLAKQMGTDGDHLRTRKEFIKTAVVNAIHAMQEEQEESDDSEGELSSSEEESEDDEDDGRSRKKKGKAKKKKGSGGGGLAAVKEISDDLANFLGKGKQMSRTDIVKSLWEYIREHNLQNPSNKREILLDKPMRRVFGCEMFTMFSMNKYIGAHVHPFKPVDLSSSTKSSSSSSPTRTPKRRTATKTTAAGRKRAKAVTNSSSSSAPKKRKTGTQPPYRLSDELAALVGATAMPRPQVVSAIWDYIKKHDLQNPKDKREILCDGKLRAVMKKPKVTMFNMNQCITPHLLEKLDKADYVRNDGDDDDDSD